MSVLVSPGEMLVVPILVDDTADEDDEENDEDGAEEETDTLGDTSAASGFRPVDRQGWWGVGVGRHPAGVL